MSLKKPAQALGFLTSCNAAASWSNMTMRSNVAEVGEEGPRALHIIWQIVM